MPKAKKKTEKTTGKGRGRAPRPSSGQKTLEEAFGTAKRMQELDNTIDKAIKTKVLEETDNELSDDEGGDNVADPVTLAPAGDNVSYLAIHDGASPGPATATAGLLKRSAADIDSSPASTQATSTAASSQNIPATQGPRRSSRIRVKRLLDPRRELV